MSLEVCKNAAGDIVTVRDSENPQEVIQFSRADWAEIVAKIRARRPTFELVNAFETETGPKGESTVLYRLIAPHSTTKLYLTEAELDAVYVAGAEGRLDLDRLTEEFAAA